MARNPSSPLFKLVLLSASLLLSEASAISPTLPELAEAFPDAGQTSVQSFVTIGSVAGMVSTVVAGALAGRVGKRRLVLIGMALIALGGVAPIALVPVGSFPLLLASRLVLGVGIGFLQPLTSSVVADFYRGAERENMLGWQSAAVGGGGALWTLVVGALMLVNWKAAFLVYAFSLVCLVLFARFIPEPPAHTPADEPAAGSRAPWYRVSADVWIAAAIMLAFTAAFQGVFISMPLAFVSEKNLTTSATISLLLTVFSLSAVAVGLVFGPVVRRLRAWTGAVAATVLAVAELAMWGANSAPLGFAAAALAGIGFGCFMPFVITTTNDRATPRTSAMATALVFTGASIGGAAAPYYFRVVGELTGNTSATHQLLVAAVTLLVVAAITAARYVTTTPRPTSPTEILEHA
ncbi:MFS transporter [Kineococcus arenarius]|uniref:MFS transporter n=1 Tax=unclassified Kineococcus TaxID=2621656 RepID=UPI003D7EBDCA